MKVLTSALKPRLGYFVFRYRQRRRRFKADIVRSFLVQFMKTNSVKRRISLYVFNVQPYTYTLHPTPYTLHPTPYTLHPTPYTLHPTPYTPNPEP